MMESKTVRLTRALRNYYEGKGYYRAIRAMNHAHNIHTGFRKDGVTPEIHHQVNIAGYLKTLNEGLLYPESVHVVTWFHDALEDHPSRFYDAIREDDFLTPEERSAINLITHREGDSWQDYMANVHTSPTASVVKGADRIHNFQTMVGVFSREKRNAYVKECEDYIIPMLKRAKTATPEQTNAYYNIIHVLRTQIDLLGHIGGS